MSNPLISCVVPVYNGEDYLAEALNSILAQTYSFLEVIAVDDGSTDGTADVCHKYRENIVYLRQTKAGPASARNHGVSMANGEFIAFLDADDLWHPEKLVRQMARFGARPDLDLCLTHVKNFWISELKEEAKKFQNHRIARPLPGYVTQSLLARREIFGSVGLFNTSVKHGDAQDWFMRAAEQGIVMELLPDVLVFRRLHRSNYSREVKVSHEEHLRVLKASLDRRRSTTGKVQDYVFCDVLPDKSDQCPKS